MQVGQVKIGDFPQITPITRKRRPPQALSAQFGCTFITLSVHHCLQHVCRDAARRAGSLATADTCPLLIYCSCHPKFEQKCVIQIRMLRGREDFVSK